MRYEPFLSAIHEKLSPQTYLEIGVRDGKSLALSRSRSVGIDPAYSITAELNCDTALCRTSSDEYFSRANPLELTDGQPFDLSFIDGLHLFEFAFRDFINAERYSTPRSVIIFDDVMPRSIDEAARERHTVGWTGDIYPMIQVLADYRPEVTVIPVGTLPSGLLLVFGLDPANTVLSDNYEAILAEYRHPDPQPVPDHLLDRLAVVPPERVLQSDFWQVLSDAVPDADPNLIRTRLAERLVPTLGAAFQQAS